MTASAAQEQRGRGVRPPRPLAIPTVSFLGPRDDVGGNPRVVEAALMRAASPCSGQCLRTSSVLRCPTPPSVAVGVFDGVVKRTDVAPVWIPGMGDGALWDGYGRPARSSNAERPWRETCGTDRDPSVGSRLRSAMEDGVARRGARCGHPRVSCDGGAGCRANAAVRSDAPLRSREDRDPAHRTTEPWQLSYPLVVGCRFSSHGRHSIATTGRERGRQVLAEPAGTLRWGSQSLRQRHNHLRQTGA